MKPLRERIIEHLDFFHEININLYGTDNERTVRKVLSELRKEGNIYIPMSNGMYIHESKVNQSDLTSFYKSQLKHLQTQYFNTVRPIGKLVTDNKLTKLMGTLDEALGIEL